MKTHGNPPIRPATSNLEATGSTPVGRANYPAELRHFERSIGIPSDHRLGTMRKRAAQSGAILSQNRAQLFVNRSGSPAPSRVKRCLNTHFRQSQGFCLGSSGLETAVMRKGSPHLIALLPQGDL